MVQYLNGTVKTEVDIIVEDRHTLKIDAYFDSPRLRANKWDIVSNI